MIKPTVGRIVWYRPRSTDNVARNGEQPLAAMITGVHSDAHVNLVVFDVNGIAHSRSSVLLLQDGDTAPEAGGYAEWMPYQKGQAAATEMRKAIIGLSDASDCDAQKNGIIQTLVRARLALSASHNVLATDRPDHPITTDTSWTTNHVEEIEAIDRVLGELGVDLTQPLAVVKT